MSKYLMSIVVCASFLAVTPAKSTGVEVASAVIAATGALYSGGKFAYNLYSSRQFCKYLCNSFTCSKGAISTITQKEAKTDVDKIEQSVLDNPQIKPEVKETIKTVKS